MSRLKISYSLTRRSSQSRIASAYLEMLATEHDIIGMQDAADLVIVHHPPRNYETVYALHPALKDRYVVSCCVPHAEDVPDLWKRNLERVQEVWTPSEFCRQALVPYHPNVVVMPYVIERDLAISTEARTGVSRMIGFDPDFVYFLMIAPLEEPRKNIPALVETFKRVCGDMPRARLVIKASTSDVPSWVSHPQIIFLPLQMPFDYISALHELSTIYVSAHHAEGWGVTISDAMLFAKPVIATGYSGNLEYMNEHNAFPIRYTHGEVADIPAPGIAVDPGMRWSEPDTEHLAELLLDLYSAHGDTRVQDKVKRATTDIRRFNRDAVQRIINQRVEEIAHEFQAS
ncbi:MAG TPA: glycosyltransferase [Luteibacter sp.]|jgi:glycosyltransferase involved in cell wall biosynthesis|uniref:glycosyltransferase n=1 Tax=Luteibacter sp. TaxID=1886636 RepID=UPI002F3EBEF3